MGALTVAFILADYYFNRSDRVLTHIFLGSISTILFYALCKQGYEVVNWVFLGIIPIYIFFSLLSKYFSRKLQDSSDTSDMSETCDVCDEPIETCGCTMPKPKPKPKRESDDCGCNTKSKTKPLGCPVNPIKLATECGISRYT